MSYNTDSNHQELLVPLSIIIFTHNQHYSFDFLWEHFSPYFMLRTQNSCLDNQLIYSHLAFACILPNACATFRILPAFLHFLNSWLGSILTVLSVSMEPDPSILIPLLVKVKDLEYILYLYFISCYLTFSFFESHNMDLQIKSFSSISNLVR